MIDVTTSLQIPHCRAETSHHMLTFCGREARKRGKAALYLVPVICSFPFLLLFHLPSSLDLNKVSIHPIELHQ